MSSFQENKILASPDNGINWQDSGQQFNGNVGNVPRNVPPSGFQLVDLCALNGQQAWLITQRYDNGLTQLRYTSTGPANFAVSAAQVAGESRFVHFFTPSVGVLINRPASGSTNLSIFRTTDGGASWQPIGGLPALPGGDQPTRATFYNTHYWVSTGQGQLYHTPDAGLTWTTSTCPQPFYSLAFRDAQHGLANGTGAGRPLYRTTDGGVSWSPVSPLGRRRLYKFAALPGSAGTYVSIGTGNYSATPDTPGTAVSYDDGQNWLDLGGTNWMTDVTADLAGRVWGGNYGNGDLLRFANGVLATASPQLSGPLVFPNPTTGRVELATAGTYAQVRLYNATGGLALTQPLAATDKTIDLTALPDGLYTLHFYAKGRLAAQQRLVLCR